MKKFYLLIFSLANLFHAFSQDTFSIVAVDSVTGEVGSAGTSCLEDPGTPNGCLIISNIVPGLGSINTQALWNQYNQEAALAYMEAGYLPGAIIYNVNISDVNGGIADSDVRQYGVALFTPGGHPAAAAFTGDSDANYHGDIVGPYYAIQGNILLGPQILDSMQSRFLNTPGQLAVRLMAALQGANVPGADSRCLAEGVPGESSFVRVAKPTDSSYALYCDLRVISRPYGLDPIDSLQTLFNAWELANPASVRDISLADGMKVYPNPVLSLCNVQFADDRPRKIKVLNTLGSVVLEQECNSRLLQFSTAGFARGAYFIEAENSVYKLIVQ